MCLRESWVKAGYSTPVCSIPGGQRPTGHLEPDCPAQSTEHEGGVGPHLEQSQHLKQHELRLRRDLCFSIDPSTNSFTRQTHQAILCRPAQSNTDMMQATNASLIHDFQSSSSHIQKNTKKQVKLILIIHFV